MTLLAQSFSVEAQKRTTFGLVYGINFSKWDQDADKFSRDLAAELNCSGFDYCRLENRPRFGINFGMSVDIPITNYFSLQPELVYENKGTRFKGSGTFEGIDVDMTYVMVNNYVTVPLLLNMHTSGNEIYLCGGPSLNFNTKSAMKVTVEAFGESETDTEKYEGIKPIDFCWIIAGGLQFDNLRLELRYEKGTDNITKENYAEGYQFVNSTISVNLIIMFDD